MEPSLPPPPPPPESQRPKLHEMEFQPPLVDDPSSSSLWDWGDLLDFTVDDQFPISLDSVDTPTIIPSQVNSDDAIENSQVADRVRKRDPRLACANFLAGRVPCACPELDAKLEEEEGTRGKKRVRTARANLGIARCQVPGCEVDISELKGYHRRHRVCLRCANASTVVLDGENKRYCQQCGKFHVLSDFDEGKRSCRRKLERHNNRRRRKPHDSKGAVEKELLSEDNAFDGEEAGKDDCQIIEKEALVESEDGNVSTLQSGPSSQNINSDSGLSVGTPKDGGKDDSKFPLSPSNCDTKTFYSSVCPTGRISFKLYDWNPAEFPRRLRHQIFEWLANMPVELEGYIRPGCTILTAFLAMPAFMWAKLSEDPVSFLHDFVIVPGKMLSNRSPMLVYINNMIFRVLKDGNSVMKVNMEGQAPRLHYVYPMWFEAGKPIEFVAGGSNILQPKFRLLVSFAGKYITYDHCVALPHCNADGCSNNDHQLCKIRISHVESNVFGPAFIEVENERGLSNFIPVLIGDEDICSQMKAIQQKFGKPLLSSVSQCKVLEKSQVAFSEFIVDIAWLLKKPSAESFQQFMNSAQIQRLHSLLNFLLHHELTAILDKVSQNLKILLDEIEINRVVYGISDSDMKLLQECMDHVNSMLHRKVKISDDLALHCASTSEEGGSESDKPSVAPFNSEDLESNRDLKLAVSNSSPVIKSEKIPLLNREVVMDVNIARGRPNKSCSMILSNRIIKSRPTIFLVGMVAVCLGVCAVLLHPNQVSKFAVSIRRCLTDRC